MTKTTKKPATKKARKTTKKTTKKPATTKRTVRKSPSQSLTIKMPQVVLIGTDTSPHFGFFKLTVLRCGDAKPLCEHEPNTPSIGSAEFYEHAVLCQAGDEGSSTVRKLVAKYEIEEDDEEKADEADPLFALAQMRVALHTLEAKLNHAN